MRFIVLMTLSVLSLAASAQTESEPNNSFSEADLVTLTDNSGEISGAIATRGDDDYYRIEVARAGVFVANVTSIDAAIDMGVELYDAGENRLGRVVESDGTPVEYIQLVCEPGTYYFRLYDSGANNSSADTYQLKVTFDILDAYECNNTFTDAAPIDIGDVISAQIYSVGDEDYYRLDVPHAGVFVADVTSVNENIDMGVELYDAGENRLGRVTTSDGSPVRYTQLVCDPGTYYFRLYDAGSNNLSADPYQLTVAFDTLDAYECNNSFTDAAPIDIGEEISAQIYSIGDDDYYRLDVSRAGVFVADVSSINEEIDMAVELYDVGENRLGRVTASDGAPVNYTQLVCDPGTYYFRLYDSGSNNLSADPYQLTVAFDTSDVYECNNSFTDASTIEVGDTISAQIYSIGDDDYYQLDVSRAGVFIADVSSINEAIDMVVELYDAAENRLGRVSRSDGSPVTYTQLVCDPGTYYFRLYDAGANNLSADPYQLQVAFDTSDVYECNNSFTDAAAISSGDTISAQIYSVGDEDYYQLEVERAGVFIANVTSINEEIDLAVELYDAGENSLGRVSQSDGRPVYYNQLLCTPGTYYVRLYDSGSNNLSADPYQLTVMLDTSDVYECNNTLETAAPVALCEDIRGALASGSDIDVYRFAATESDTISILLADSPSNILVTATVLDLAGNSLLSVTQSTIGEDLLLEFTPAESNDYYVAISNGQRNVISQELYTLRLANNGCPPVSTTSHLEGFVKFYPNPANERLTVDIDPSVLTPEMIVTIYDATGRQIKQQKVGGSRQVLELNDLPTGMLTVSLTTSHGVTIVKTIIKR